MRFGQIALHVRKLSAGGTIEQISMLICSDESEAGDSHCSEPSDEKPLPETSRFYLTENL